MAERLTLADLIYKLGFENEDEFVRSLETLYQRTERQSEDSGEKAGKSFLGGMRDSINRTGDVFLGNLLADLFQKGMQAAQQFASDSVRAFSAYEQGLVQLRLAGETNLEPIEDQMEAIARASGVFSRTDVSLGMGDLVKAGFSVQQALTLVAQSADLAASEIDPLTGQFGDLSGIAAQAGQILRAMGMDFSQTGRVIDVMAKSAQDSSADITDLVDAIAVVGPFAANAGLSIEEASGAIALLTNQGIQASTAGRGLRSVLAALVDPPKAVKEQFEALGLTLVQADGTLRPFSEVLENLGAVVDSGAQGTQLLAQGMDTMALSVASALGSASGELNLFTRELEGSEGAAKELADTVRDSAAAELATMRARIEDAKVELGEQLVPVMVDTYEVVLPGLIGALSTLIEKWEQWNFLLTGSTPGMEQAREKFRSQFSPEQLVILDDMTELTARRVSLEEQLAAVNDRIENGVHAFGSKRRLQAEAQHLQEELDATRFLIERAEADLRRVNAERRAAAEAAGEGGGGGEGTPPPRTTPPPSSDKGEKKKDPIVEEAERVARDATSRLRPLFDLERLGPDEYEAQLEAHLRRVQGLYEEAVTPEQTTAILRAETTLTKALEKLSEDRVNAEIETALTIEELRAEEEARARQAVETMTRAEKERQAAIEQARQVEIEAATRGVEAMLALNERDAEVREQLEVDYLRAVGRERDAALLEERQRHEERLEAAEGNAQLVADIERNHAADVARINEEFDAQEQRARERAAEEAARLAEQEARAREREAEDAARRAEQGVRARVQAEAEALRLAGNHRAAAILEEEERLRQDLERSAALGLGNREQLVENSRARIAEINQRFDEQEERARLEQAQMIEEERNRQVEEQLAAIEVMRTAALEQLSAETKLIRAKIALGEATTGELGAALKQQIATLEALIPVVQEGSEWYYVLVDALRKARAELEQITGPKDIEGVIPDDTELKNLERDLESLFEGAGRTLVEGIKEGDLEGALSDIFGSATDFFIGEMIKGIVGPIAARLAASIASATAASSAGGLAKAGAGGLGALGPWGAIAGIAALGFMAMQGGGTQRTEVVDNSKGKGSSGGAPAITYNLNASVNVNAGGDFNDPAFYSRWRTETENLVIGLLQRTKRTNGGAA